MAVCYLIRTNALDSDERFDKTCRFLTEAGQDVVVYGVVKRQSPGWDGAIQQELRLRNMFGSGRFVTLKYVELLIVTAWFLLRHRGRRWFANFDFLPLQLISTALASTSNRPIWDLHEMPPKTIARSPVLRQLFRFMLRRSHVIACNHARVVALEEAFGVDLSNTLVLRNTPGRKAFNRLVSARAEYLATTNQEEDLHRIIIIGGNAPGRYVQESIEVAVSVREATGIDLRVTLVGGAPLENAPSFVKSTGFIPFDDLVSRCVQGGISLCFYRMDSLNNILCEPNRFYQGLVAGQYVISFDHPSLRDLNYAQHIRVDDADFATSLHAALERILSGSLSLQDPAQDCESAVYIFDRQLPAFKAWFPKR